MWVFPNPDSIDGTFVRLERLNAAGHTVDLFRMATTGNDDNRIFRFMMFGPFQDEGELAAWIREIDTAWFSIIDEEWIEKKRRFIEGLVREYTPL